MCSAVKGAQGAGEGLDGREFGVGEDEPDAGFAADGFVFWADGGIGGCGFGPEFGGWDESAGEVEGAGLRAGAGVAVGVEV